VIHRYSWAKFLAYALRYQFNKGWGLITMDTDTLEREALHLPVSERAKLAHNLLLSLENLSDAELSEAWLDEAQRRAAEIDCGTVTLISAEEVSAKARALLK